MMKKLTIMIMLVLAVSISAFSQTTITVSSSASLESLLKNLSGSIATLNIEGELSADDVAALSNTDVVAKLNALGVQNLLMNKATVAADARKADFNFAGNTAVETIILPKDLPEVKASWFASCTKLGTAISYSADGKTLRAHSNKAGTLGDAFKKLTLNGTASDLGSSYTSETRGFTNPKITSVVYSGKCSVSDIGYAWGNSLNTAQVENFDLSQAEYEGDFSLSEEQKKCVETIKLPKNITTIPASTFFGCTNLKSVTVPGTVTSVGDNAFSECHALTDVVFEESSQPMTFGKTVFYNCYSMKHIVLPEYTANIGEGMFKKCSSLEALRIPNTVEQIGANAFEEAKALTDITIPISVKEIGAKAFFNSGLRDIYVMATKPEDMPKIYCYPNNSYYSETTTFGGQLDGNNSTPSGDVFKKILLREVRRKMVPGLKEEDVNNMNNYQACLYLTSEQMEEGYRTMGVNSMVMLHYVDNKEMNEFLNDNPLKYLKEGTEEYNASITEWANNVGGVAANYTVMDGYPNTYDECKTAESKRMHGEEHLNDTYGMKDKYGKYWPDMNHGDLKYRRRYGDPSQKVETSAYVGDDTSEPSIIGWRQFILQSGFSPANEDEVFKKRYDNTWYTMCFPFDLTDEQLEGAFNTSFNICEFSGAAIQKATKQNSKGENVEVNNLVLLFTEIATTYRMDKYGNVYERTGTKPNYTYTIKERQKNDDGTWQLASTSKCIPGTKMTSMTSSDTDVADIYESMKGYLAFAGHPYMIHPYNVEKDGKATDCVINHVRYKFDYNKLTGDAKAAAREKILKLYEEETVTRPLSDIVGDVSDFFGNNYDDDRNKADRPVHLKDSGKGKYSFQGTFFPKGEEKVIPYGAYFLGTRGGAKYPKFYREISKDDQRTKGIWKQYSAIILPNENAAAWEATNLNQPTTNTNAKGMDMLFGDFDFVDPMDIEEIVDEALARGEKVQQWNVIVNINGQVVRQGTDVQGLPSGIYIVNGKKYFVKN